MNRREIDIIFIKGCNGEYANIIRIELELEIFIEINLSC
jgi:hypothetical protein